MAADTHADELLTTTRSARKALDRLKRCDGRRAIAEWMCAVERNAESASQITDEVIAMMAGAMKVATHDGADPSYQRPLITARGR